MGKEKSILLSVTELEPLGIGAQTVKVLQIRHYIWGKPLILSNKTPGCHHIMRYFQSVQFARLF